MSYGDDVAALVRLEKLRLLALVIALGSSLAAVIVDLDWIHWPRAFGWLAGAVVCALEARVEKRLGRDPDGSWLRAVMFGLVAAMYLVLAVRG